MGVVMGILSKLGAVGKWLWNVSVATINWSTAFPVVSIGLGIGMAILSRWLARQPWAGAETLSAMVGFTAGPLFFGGVGGWIGSKLAAKSTKVRKVSTALGWYLPIGKVLPGLLSPWRWLGF